jgi:hypothetical protein
MSKNKKCSLNLSNKICNEYAIYCTVNDKQVLAIDYDCNVYIKGKLKYNDKELKESIKKFAEIIADGNWSNK